MTAAMLVPAPVLPPTPERIELSSPVVLVLGGLLILVILVFVVRVIRVILGHPQSPRALRITLGLAAAALALTAAAGVTDTVQRDARDDAIREWHAQAGEAARTAEAELEQAYGFTFDSSSPFVPVEKDQTFDESVTFSDGTSATCWVTIVQDHYEVVCGDSLETAVPLEPVTP